MAKQRLWDKGGALDEQILKFTAGEDHKLDARLVAYDVRASIAHARMLAERNLLSSEDCDAICIGLAELGEAHARGEWAIALEEEDAHSALERRLIERIGEAGGRVHLGRSRNDQVLAAMRLYIKDSAATLGAGACRVADALEAIAHEQGTIALPGYTHMQRAMPSGRKASPRSYVTMPPGSHAPQRERIRTRWARRPATVRPASISIVKRRAQRWDSARHRSPSRQCSSVGAKPKPR